MSGPWGIVRLCRTSEIRGNLIRLLRNMPYARARLWRRISRLTLSGRPLKHHFHSRPSGCWLQSVAGRAWRGFLVSISQASSPGGCGGRFTSANCPAWTKRFVWHLIGHWIFSSPRTFAQCTTSIDRRDFHRPDQARNTSGNNGDHERAHRAPDGLIDPRAAEMLRI